MGTVSFGADKNALKLTVKVASQLCEYVKKKKHTHTQRLICNL